MNLVVFEAEQWEAAAFGILRAKFDLNCTADSLVESNAAKFRDAEIITVFVNSNLTASVLAQLPNLKFIATRSTGFDHIDLECCARSGIAVANVPDYGDVTVAEHVFALLLSLARHLTGYRERAAHADFARANLRGFELYGKIMGVIGTGRIGRRVIQIARGFGMQVIAYDVTSRDALARELGFCYVDFHQLLSEADVVSLHLPAAPATTGLIGDAEFSLMKPGAVLINTARGNIVQIEALVRAIESGRLQAAGLDVLPLEPLIRDEAEVFRDRAVDETDLRSLLAYHFLTSAPNVLITPHVAYNTEDALRRLIATTIENIRAFSARRPLNLVGKEMPSYSDHNNQHLAKL